MKRRIALGLTVLLVAVAAVVGTPAVSNAVHDTPTTCYQHGGTKTCVAFEWRFQNDGTGVFVEAAIIDVSMGCSDLESAYPIKDLSAYTEDPGNGDVIESTQPATLNDCHAYRTLNLRGPDNGSTYVALWMTAAVDNGFDYRYRTRCLIRPNNPDFCELG